ncbi:MAG: hypothetical protein QXP27_09670, partial [Candidatus Methanomethyliaceae archaeon]
VVLYGNPLQPFPFTIGLPRPPEWGKTFPTPAWEMLGYVGHTKDPWTEHLWSNFCKTPHPKRECLQGVLWDLPGRHVYKRAASRMVQRLPKIHLVLDGPADDVVLAAAKADRVVSKDEYL